MIAIAFGVAGGILLACGVLYLLGRWKVQRAAAAAKHAADVEAEKRAFVHPSVETRITE
jgi:cytochrome oxidase assembly protein ShyY1